MTLSLRSRVEIFRPGQAAAVTTLLLCAVMSSSYASAESSEYASKIQATKTKVLTLNMVTRSAQDNDPWLVGNRHQQDSIESLSVASGTLPDPKVSIGLANLATDTADFNQEGMTQFKVGIMQTFPRGDSLSIKRKNLELMSSQYPYLRQDRRAKVIVNVAHQWLDAYKAQESIALIERDRSLFEQLADVAEASYSAAFGNTRQQDIVRAQLELTRLEDRLTVLNLQRDVALQRLSEWLSTDFVPQQAGVIREGGYVMGGLLSLDKNLPDIKLIKPNLYHSEVPIQSQLLYPYFEAHASVRGLEQKIEASATGIELARQKYKPEWSVNASYGYRDEDLMGNERADLFSVGVSFDLPIFTANKQDKEVQSALSSTEALRAEKWLMLRKMMASFETSKAQLLRLDQRSTLYKDKLLPQMHDQAEASLTSYTNDDGDFSEVVRARIAELNANIDALGIDVDRQKSRVQLNYFLMTDPNQIIASRTNTSGTNKSAGNQEQHHE